MPPIQAQPQQPTQPPQPPPVSTIIQQLAQAKQYPAVYEQLRNFLMGLHQFGVPGIDVVLKAVNDQHVKLIGPDRGNPNSNMPSSMQ